MYREKEEIAKQAKISLWVAALGGLVFVMALFLQHRTLYELFAWLGGLTFVISVLYWVTSIWEG